jgi:hypothetical protein
MDDMLVPLAFEGGQAVLVPGGCLLHYERVTFHREVDTSECVTHPTVGGAVDGNDDSGSEEDPDQGGI